MGTKKRNRGLAPEDNLLYRLRTRTKDILRGIQCSQTTQELLGMDPLDVVAYLNDISEDLTFGDTGVQVDHIIPCRAFKIYGDLKDPFYQKAMCNYRNLQLLTASANSSKGGKCDFETFYSYISEFKALTGLVPLNK